MREPGIPSLQVSWSAADPRFGEIDIDYRSRGWAHGYPANSDIRAEHRGIPHYCLHKEKYESELIDWWNGETPESCESRNDPLEGWVRLGATRNPSEWPFDVQGVELPVSGLQPNEEVGVLKIVPPSGTLLSPHGYIGTAQCASLTKLDERRGERWARVQRVEC